MKRASRNVVGRYAPATLATPKSWRRTANTHANDDASDGEDDEDGRNKRGRTIDRSDGKGQNKQDEEER